MDKIKLAIIGCGGIANKHLTHLLQMEEAEVTALVAGNRERLTETGKRVPNARLYANWQDLLDKMPNLDAAVICATPERHGAMEAVLAARGIHLYIEKPLGLTMDEVRANERAVISSGVICSVGYQERYNPAIKLVQDFLKQEKVGLVSGSYLANMPSPLWWRTKSRSGGQVVEQATHIFDVLRFLLGEADTVFSIGASPAGFGVLEHDVDLFSSTILHFQSGSIANLNTGCYLKDNSTGDIGFTFYGEQAKLQYRWNDTLTITKKGETTVKEIGVNTHFLALQAFVQAVKNDDQSLVLSNYSDAARSLELTLLANSSMVVGEAMRVPSMEE